MSNISEPANKLRQMIAAAIEDEKITPQERDDIMNLAAEDGVVDAQEQALLAQLQEMIHSGAVRLEKE